MHSGGGGGGGREGRGWAIRKSPLFKKFHRVKGTKGARRGNGRKKGRTGRRKRDVWKRQKFKKGVGKDSSLGRGKGAKQARTGGKKGGEKTALKKFSQGKGDHEKVNNILGASRRGEKKIQT